MAAPGASYLTCVHPKKTNGRDLEAGVSVDQIAAKRLQGKTRFASLELGCEEGVQGGSCDNGYSCAYSNSISWRTPASPNPAEIRPRAVFERLFGAADRRPARGSALSEQHSRSGDGRCAAAVAQLGGADKRKLDEYLFSIRDVEKRIQNAETESRAGRHALDGAARIEHSDRFAEHARIMMDLMTLAFQTDATRVVTLLLALEQSPRAYPEIGIPEAHHGLTHHQGDKEKIAKVTRDQLFPRETVRLSAGEAEVDAGWRWHAARSLDDHVWQRPQRRQRARSCQSAAGAGGPRLRNAQARTACPYPEETPMANLFVAMLDRMGVPVETLGDSQGELGICRTSDR